MFHMFQLNVTPILHVIMNAGWCSCVWFKMLNACLTPKVLQVLGETGASGGGFRLARAPMTSSKHPTPPQRPSASPEGHAEPSGKTGSHGGSNHGTHSRRWDGHDRAGAWEPRSNLTWPRSFHHHDVHISTTMGVTATMAPNLLSTQIWVHAPPILNGTKAHRSKHGYDTLHQRMERPKDQRPVRVHATGELLPPDKEEDSHARGHLFCFSLSSFPHSIFLPQM
jgi:hypothetical protein